MSDLRNPSNSATRWQPPPSGPPGDSSPPCPACPGEIRNFYAVVHNMLNRREEWRQNGWQTAAHYFWDYVDRELPRALESVRPIIEAHFADEDHAGTRVPPRSSSDG